MGRVTGTIVSGEPLGLEPGTVITISLEDVSVADVAAPVIGRQVVEGATTLPVEFSIEFDHDLDPARSYNVRARIEREGRLLYISDRSHLPNGPELAVTVSPVAAAKRLDVDPYLGRWTGTWRTWVEPEVLHDESAIAMTIIPVLGGTDMIQSYEATIGNDPVEGTALIGPSQRGMTVAWVDTWHTNGLVLTSHGDLDDEGFTVSTVFTAEGQDWTWTTRFAIEGTDLVVRHWNEGPGVPRYLGVEARLHRG